jgi:hypothetical protein
MYLCHLIVLQMTGQDSIMNGLPVASGNALDTVITGVFAASGTTGTVLSPDQAILIPKEVDFHPVWVFLYIFTLLGLFAWIRVYYGNIFSQTVQASTNFQVAVRMFKDKSTLQNQLDNILYGFYFLSLAYFLFFMEERLDLVPYKIHGILLYLFNLALLAGIFMARVILMNLLGSLFNQLALFREYLYHTFIFNKLLGVSTLSLLLFVVFTRGVLQEVFIWIITSTVVTVLIMRFIRGLTFSFRKDISIFYMFLYLCALELVPFALLFRWLKGIL